MFHLPLLTCKNTHMYSMRQTTFHTVGNKLSKRYHCLKKTVAQRCETINAAFLASERSDRRYRFNTRACAAPCIKRALKIKIGHNARLTVCAVKATVSCPEFSSFVAVHRAVIYHVFEEGS